MDTKFVWIGIATWIFLGCTKWYIRRNQQEQAPKKPWREPTRIERYAAIGKKVRPPERGGNKFS